MFHYKNGVCDFPLKHQDGFLQDGLKHNSQLHLQKVKKHNAFVNIRKKDKSLGSANALCIPGPDHSDLNWKSNENIMQLTVLFLKNLNSTL